MTFTESIRTCFTKYADFQGCAGKSEYWWWVLFTVVATLSLQIISENVSLAFSVATALPSAAVTTRRLHDTDRNGWLQLLVLIPIIGWIFLIIWYVQDGKRPNRFCQ